jgi:uncharacterized protein (TIGR00255 family)
MAKSMTGFGRAQSTGGRFAAEVEIRSLNNRFLKVRTHAPSFLSMLEPEIEDFIRNKLSRGAVDIWVTITDVAPAEAYDLDIAVVKRYRDFAAQLANEMGIQGRLDISHFLSLPGVVSSSSGESRMADELRSAVMDLLSKAMDALEEMRLKEGRALADDIGRRARLVGDFAQKVKVRVPEVVAGYRDRLLARIKELLAGSNVEMASDDILKEISIFAERSDISEEISRIASHVKQLEEALAADGEIGRKLEFVAQELHREVNTIGSKANDAVISRAVVDAKGEVDRIREQAANLE